MRLLPLSEIAMMLMMSCMAGKKETKEELAPVERRIEDLGALWPLCNNCLHCLLLPLFFHPALAAIGITKPGERIIRVGLSAKELAGDDLASFCIAEI